MPAWQCTGTGDTYNNINGRCYVFILVFTCILCNTLVNSSNWSPRVFPSPLINGWKCGRRRNVSLVCDPDHIISQDSADKIDDALMIAHNTTPCICSNTLRCSGWGGFRIGVVLVRALPKSYLRSFDSDEKAMNSFTKSVRRDWFRDIGCDDNVLVLIVQQNSQVVMSTGIAARYELTMSESGGICISTRFHFLQGEYELGVMHIIHKLVQDINDPITSVVESAIVFGIFATIVFALLGILAFCYSIGRLGGQNVMKFPLGAPMGFRRSIGYSNSGSTHVDQQPNVRVGNPHGRQGRRTTIFGLNFI
ncbi:uncharacterized protein LOC144349477 [Saccoglossus kowalevskii]